MWQHLSYWRAFGPVQVLHPVPAPTLRERGSELWRAAKLYLFSLYDADGECGEEGCKGVRGRLDASGDGDMLALFFVTIFCSVQATSGWRYTLLSGLRRERWQVMGLRHMLEDE